MIRALFLSVVPSPYQRDLFHALAKRPELEMHVCYLERVCEGYPWPKSELEPWEQVLPGRKLSGGHYRVHLNTRLPDFAKFDVVVLNTHLPALTTQWAMRRALRHQKWIFWGERLRNNNFGWKLKLQNLLAAPLRRASAIAAIGTLAERDYRRRFPKGRIFNIPYYCTLDGFFRAPHPSNGANEVTFIFCGIINRRKGADLLLRAFDRLVASGAPVRLRLVGQEAELPEFLQGLSPKTRARVHYEGFQPPERLPDYFARANVFVLPSRYDGWGVVVNQALGAGLPIVCSDTAGAGHDLVEPDINGLLFKGQDENGLFGCLKRFVDSPDLCHQWGRVSRRKAGDWTPEVGAARWVEAITQVCRSST